MKTRLFLWMLLGGAVGLSPAQMPTSAAGNGTRNTAVPTSFDATGSSVKPAADDPARRGETPPPQLFGMELPLLDPASDTVSYNGGQFDVGNNALVRARFEKFLQQLPDNSDESKRYRKLIEDILRETQRGSNDKRYEIGSAALIRMGKNLYIADKYPGDGGQSGALASAMVSALDAQRKMRARERQNDKYDEDINSLMRQANYWTNDNERRRAAAQNANGIGAPTAGKNAKGGDKGGGSGPSAMLNTVKLTHHVETMAKNEASKVANITANEATLLQAKTDYQSTLITMLLSRRFDHVVIGARVYRHLFKDGDTKLNLKKDSKANEIFSGGAGLPPTINVVGSVASNARREVDQNIQAVHSMLAQNKLGEATQHLIEAVAIGEYMQSVATFPTEARQRIAAYWTLRKQALMALNARDYAKVEEIATKMSELDVDFNDSALRSYTTARKRQSDFAIRNAAKALRENNEEDFKKYMEEATIVWPMNPRLDEAAAKLVEIDEGDPIKEEFRNLFNEKQYRRIALARERFKIVAMDPELAKMYEEVITLVMKMDGMIEQLNAAAEQDAKLGPCAAYEKMIEWQAEDPRYAEDEKMRDALHNYESHAHDFVDALRGAERSCERREFGSALSAFYRAQCIYPQSKQAKAGIRRVMDIIVKATYD